MKTTASNSLPPAAGQAAHTLPQFTLKENSDGPSIRSVDGERFAECYFEGDAKEIIRR